MRGFLRIFMNKTGRIKILDYMSHKITRGHFRFRFLFVIKYDNEDTRLCNSWNNDDDNGKFTTLENIHKNKQNVDSWLFKLWYKNNVWITCLVNANSCRNHHHHHVAPPARISLTVSRHFSLSFIASGRSSGLHPVSSHSCCM